jgi:hypothetical protein
MGEVPLHMIRKSHKTTSPAKLEIWTLIHYRGTVLITNNPSLGPYSGPCLWPYGDPRGGGLFLLSEVQGSLGIRTRAPVGSYSRPMSRSIGPP